MPVLGGPGDLIAKRSHSTIAPFGGISYANANACCGLDAALGKMWVYSGGTVSQADSLTATTFQALTLPPNMSPSGQQVKIVTYTPPSGSKLMFLCTWNTTSSRYEVYSAAPVAAGTAPTWSGPLLQLSANATLMPTAFRATTGGVLIGEYSGGTDIAGGPSVWRSTDGVTFTQTLGPLGSTSRHIHGVFEDPFNPGSIYVPVGDYISPYAPPFAMYRSADGGATFTGVPSLANRIWQTVGMGFTSDYAWCLSDQYDGGGPFVLDRASLTPRWATTKSRHDQMAVPGGAGARVVTDAVFNGGSTVTSATANFTTYDLGRTLGGSTSVQLGAVITNVASATTISMSINAMTSFSGQTLVIGGDRFFANAYAGAVDPASGWLYLVANDTSGPGTTAGVFVLTGPDQPFTLLYTLPNAFINRNEAYIGGGYLFIDRHRLPLLTGTL